MPRQFTLDELREASEALIALRLVQSGRRARIGCPQFGILGCSVAVGLFLVLGLLMVLASGTGSALALGPAWEGRVVSIGALLFLPLCAVVTWLVWRTDGRTAIARADALDPDLRAQVESLREEVEAGPADFAVQVEGGAIPVLLRADGIAVLVDLAGNVLFASPADFKLRKSEMPPGASAKLRVLLKGDEPMDGTISSKDIPRLREWRRTHASSAPAGRSRTTGSSRPSAPPASPGREAGAVLASLDSVPWRKLLHAYGSAADVPELIRGLASDDPEVRDDARDQLFSNIVHQGTVYEASSHAVPFLIGLALARDVADQALILCLLHAIATGSSYAACHEHMHKHADFEERLRVESGWVHQAHEAVKQHLSSLRPLLQSQDGMLRAGAAHLLGAFPELAATLGPELRDAIQAEPHGLIRAGFVLALGQLADTSNANVAFLEHEFRSATEITGRRAAAVAIVATAGAQALPEAATLLEEAVDDGEDASEWFQGLPWDVGECNLEELVRSRGCAAANQGYPLGSSPSVETDPEA